MDSPGIFALLNTAGEEFTIDEAGTQIGEVVEDLEGILALALHARFSYGAGGTSCIAYVQTSLDQGTTWIDIASFPFGTESQVWVVNLSALTPATTLSAPEDGTLYEGTVFDGPLGDRFRAKVVTVGTYSGSTLLTLRGCAR